MGVPVVGAFWTAGVLVLERILFPLAWRVMAALGFGYISFTGGEAAVSALLDSIDMNFSGLPEWSAQAVAAKGVPSAFGMLVSAYTARLTLSLLGAGRWVQMGKRARRPVGASSTS